MKLYNTVRKYGARAVIGGASLVPFLAFATDDPSAAAAVTAIGAVGTSVALVIAALITLFGGFAVAKAVIGWMRRAH